MRNNWHPSRLGPYDLGFISLGQASAWTQRANAAISQYDALVKRTAALKDDATRQAILTWLGDPSSPGSPADRYQFVKDDVAQNVPWTNAETQHVTDLEAVNVDFSARVTDGEKSGTYGPFGPLSIVTPQGQLTGVGIGLVAVAALSLLVVPFVFK